MIHASRLLSARPVNLAAIGLLLSAAVASGQAEDPRGMKVLYREPRAALVIGNGAYASSPLANPVNDAEAIATLLEKRNFKVTLLKNADLAKMEAAVDLFGQSLGAGGVGLFFYAGHGMQIEGRNYLIPVGATIENERDVKYNALDVGKVLGKMEDAGNRLNIVFLDACRDNPFARSFRTAATGLAQMDAPSGTLIAYATAPGKLAADGVDSSNSIYTRYLIEQLGVPGQEISPALQAVRRQVIETSGKRQIPWESTSLTGAFYLTPIDMLDENLALSRAQLESLRKLQSEQAQAAANLRKLETEKNAEMAKLDAEIARLRQQAQQPGQSGSSLDQIVALGRKRKAAAEELAAAQRKAEEERQKREAEIAQVKAVARAKRKAEFEAAYATYQEAVELADKGYLGAAEHQAAWQTICGDFGVKNPGDKPAALAWNDTDGTVQLALPDSANDAKLSSSFQFASVASFFASKNITNTVDYVVQRGDSLGSIANGHKTTVELIQVLNNIRTPNTIKIGDRLRVFNGEFNVDIHYPEAQLIIVLDGNLFWKYKIRVGSSTISPVGSFVIAAKVAEPTWWPPSGHEIPFGHPDNVLGSRWISLRATGSTPDIRGFGIHGTWTPLTKTDKSLSGLVEMNNTDVEEIFTYLPVGTQVRLHN